MPTGEFALLVLVLISLCGLKDTGAQVGPPQVSVRGRGSSLPKYVMTWGNPNWVSNFNSMTNNIMNVSYTPSTAEDGEKSAIYKITEFGLTQGALDEEHFHSLNETLIQFPIALLGLVIAYNVPGLSQPLNLTADQIAQIFQRNVTMWNDPIILATNPNLEYSGPISAYVRSDRAGVTMTFTRFLGKASTLWKLGVDKLVNWPPNTLPVAGAGNEVVAVSKLPGSICYAFYGHAVDNMVPYANMKNADGNWVSLTSAGVAAAAIAEGETSGLPFGGQDWERVNLNWQAGPITWPMTTFSCAMWYQNLTYMGPRGPALMSFMTYLNNDVAQNLLNQYHFTPMPAFMRLNNMLSITSTILALPWRPSDYWNSQATTLPPPTSPQSTTTTTPTTTTTTTPPPSSGDSDQGAIASLILMILIPVVIIAVIVMSMVRG